MEENKALAQRDDSLPDTLSEDKEQPKPVARNIQGEITLLIPTAGTIDMTEAQKKILFAPVNKEDVEIRPDGLIYLPWMEYVSRLKDAFGIAWAIIPYSPITRHGNLFVREYCLVIEGKLAGFAFGEQTYQPDNYTMTYGDALEGMKSNALMRLCKGIGISLELWKPSFIREWKDKYAESYEEIDKRGNKKTKWRKKGSNGNGEQKAESEDKGERVPHSPPPGFQDYYERMGKIENFFELQAWWSKHSGKMKTNLTEKEMKEITAYKDFLKKEFEEKK